MSSVAKHASSSFEKNLAVVGDERELLTGGELLQCDKLTFKERFQIRTIQAQRVRRIPKQHEGGKFMWTEHLRLLAIPVFRCNPIRRSHLAGADRSGMAAGTQFNDGCMSRASVPILISRQVKDQYMGNILRATWRVPGAQVCRASMSSGDAKHHVSCRRSTLSRQDRQKDETTGADLVGCGLGARSPIRQFAVIVAVAYLRTNAWLASAIWSVLRVQAGQSY